MARERTGPQVGYWEVQQDNADTKLGSGELVEKWQANFETFAEVQPMSGREFVNVAQVEANVTHKVRISWRPDKVLTADMRLVELPNRTRALHLAGPPIDVDERHEWWEFFATEKVANPRT